MKIRVWAQRMLLSLTGAGLLLQTGSCALEDADVRASLASLFEELIAPQPANVLTDTAFFLLDNALVRLMS